ncbi:MAG TPA: hypothetical protein VGQ83_17195 [Polyangia bacterium]
MFDRELTTLDQAIAIRGRPCVAFGLRVSEIKSIALLGEPPTRLRVWPDPIPSRPGGEGHAGVEGLDGIEGEPNRKAKVKSLMAQLAQRCRLIGVVPG